MDLDINTLLEALNEFLIERENIIAKNTTHELFKMIYPQLSADKTYIRIKNEILEYCKLLQVAELVEEYKQNDDYITRYKSLTNLSSLFMFIDNSVDISDEDMINKLRAVEERQEELKKELKRLGYTKFNFLESKKEKTNNQNVVKRDDEDDFTYYSNLFEGINDLKDALTAYCINTPVNRSLDYDIIETIQKILFEKGE